MCTRHRTRTNLKKLARLTGRKRGAHAFCVFTSSPFSTCLIRRSMYTRLDAAKSCSEEGRSEKARRTSRRHGAVVVVVDVNAVIVVVADAPGENLNPKLDLRERTGLVGTGQVSTWLELDRAVGDHAHRVRHSSILLPKSSLVALRPS